jgi:hypothetical protein
MCSLRGVGFRSCLHSLSGCCDKRRSRHAPGTPAWHVGPLALWPATAGSGAPEGARECQTMTRSCVARWHFGPLRQADTAERCQVMPGSATTPVWPVGILALWHCPALPGIRGWWPAGRSGAGRWCGRTSTDARPCHHPRGTLALWHFGTVWHSLALEGPGEQVSRRLGRAGWHCLALPGTSGWWYVGTQCR